MPGYFENEVPPYFGDGGNADRNPLDTRKGAAGNGRAFFVFSVLIPKSRRT